MVEFVTLFLGLVAGPAVVEVTVTAPVARVELYLDGRSLGAIEGEPWRMECDLGPELAPHELLAVALDDAGSELGRALQHLNIPRSRAEARLLLLGEPGAPRPQARILWEAVDFEAPRSVRLFFDGVQVEILDPNAVDLPPYDLRVPHLLRAEVEFSDAVETRAEIVLGGRYGHELETELTAIIVERQGRKKLTPKALEGAFLRDERPLTVAAIEKLPADVFVVRDLDPKNLSALTGLVAARRGHIGAGMEMPPGLVLGDRLRFVFPVASIRRSGSQSYHLLESSSDTSNVLEGRLFLILTGAFFRAVETPQDSQRIADAVATAGLMAASRARPRAVILIYSGGRDESHFSTAAARDYLRRMWVPLFVWSPYSEAGDSGWGPSTDISTLAKFARAIEELRERLNSQRVVWVEGGHHGGRVEISESARRIRLSGSAVAPGD